MFGGGHSSLKEEGDFQKSGQESSLLYQHYPGANRSGEQNSPISHSLTRHRIHSAVGIVEEFDNIHL